MKLVIVAGGKGTRLGFSHIPKPMVPVGGIPILEHQVMLAKRYGIQDIFILSGYLSHVISDHFGDGRRWGVSITHVAESRPLGTAGCLLPVRERFGKRFMVFYGDVMMDFDLQAFIAFDARRRAAATLVVHPNDHPDDSDLVELTARGTVKAFHPKPHDPGGYYANLVNAAVYILSDRVFSSIPSGRPSDFGKDVFPAMLEKKERLAAYRTAEYIKDMGTIERLGKVDRDWRSGKIARLNRACPRKAVFLDRDGVINEEVNLLHRPDDFRLLPRVPEAIRRINASEYLALVITNQPVVARNLCSLGELNVIHRKMETLLGREKAMLDAIYFCPHHPDGGYPGENKAFKVACRCRKPETGLVDRARDEFNIEIEGSYFIGDSWRDVECGKKAGLTTIGVMTGGEFRDGSGTPDYMFDDLFDAVSFIVDQPFSRAAGSIAALVADTACAGRRRRPFLVCVGGNSRSGKTVFSTFLKYWLEKKGHRTLVIPLDLWLLPAGERTPEMNVFDRFQTDRSDRDIRQLLAGERIRLFPYQVRSRSRGDKAKELQLGGADVVILEGVVALAMPTLTKSASVRVHMDAGNRLLRRRLTAFYRWKGLADPEIRALINIRKLDEYKIINDYKTLADIVIHTARCRRQ